MGFRDDLRAMLDVNEGDTEKDIGLNPRFSIGDHSQHKVYFIQTSEEQNAAYLMLMSEISNHSILKHKTLYIDLEFEHKKGVKGAVPALLQLSVGQSVFVIDLLESELSQDWRSILSDQSYTWVLHDAREDVKLLVSRFLIPPPHRVFDTQVAWGLCSIISEIGLSALVYTELGRIPDKSLQAARFLNRPLPEDMLRYAAEDIPPLITLYERLSHRLGDRLEASFEASRERLSFADELYHRLNSEDAEPMRPQRSTHQLNRFSAKLWTLSPQQIAVLQRLLSLSQEMRDEHLSFSLPPKLCFHIAQLLPQNKADLLKIQGLDYTFIKSVYGVRALEEVARVIAEIPAEWSDQNMSPWQLDDRPLPQMSHSAKHQAAQVLYLCYAKLLCAELSAQSQIARAYLIDESLLKAELDVVCDREEAQVVIKSHLLRAWRAPLLGELSERLIEVYSLSSVPQIAK